MAFRFKDLVSFLSSVSGDLSNIASPPSFLAPLSVLEAAGRCWAERPHLLAATATEPTPERRALAVLKLILASMPGQLYASSPASCEALSAPASSSPSSSSSSSASSDSDSETNEPSPSSFARSCGLTHVDSESSVESKTSSKSSKKSVKVKHTTSSTPRQQAHRVTDDGIKKPLNPFLGELFLASWTDSRRQCRSRLVAEQVSHHPPVTAVHISDPDHGVTADGYARVEMTFSPAQGIRVRQIGHAVLHVDSPAGSDTDESYLVPLFDVHVRGLLSGSLYPEVLGTYRIVCSNGLVAEMKFTGESGILGRWGGGRRNAFTATIYDSRKLSSTTTPRQPIYEAEGVWSSRWTIRDARTGETVESWDADDPANAPCPIELPDEEDQDPWESRRAWAGVTSALREGDLARAAKEKTKIEQAQRAMRRHEKEQGKGEWQQLLFKRQERRKVDGEEGEGEAEEGSFLQRLLTLGACAGDGWELGEDKTKGVWAVDLAAVESMKRPFRDGLTPLG